MFALIVLICIADKPCDVKHAEIAYQGEMMALDKCQWQAIPILKALPKLPDGQAYAAACAGENYIGRKV